MPEKCSDCGSLVFRHKGEYGNFWKCEGYKKNYKDVSGKPLLLSPKCPKCGAAMRYIDKKKDGSKITPFFSCTNYPKCNGTLDKHGKPQKE